MSTMEVVLMYLLWLISFIAMTAAVSNWCKFWRWIVIILYLATVALFTWLWVWELVHPSEDANIGLGLSYFLLHYVSIAGLVVAVLTAIIRFIRRK